MRTTSKNPDKEKIREHFKQLCPEATYEKLNAYTEMVANLPNPLEETSKPPKMEWIDGELPKLHHVMFPSGVHAPIFRGIIHVDS